VRPRSQRVGAETPAAAFVGVLLLVLGIGLAVGSVLIERYERHLRAGAARTTGTVVNVLERGSIAARVIRFQTGTGEHVDFTASVKGKPGRYALGDTVPVFYAPDNPRFAGLDDVWTRWLGTMLTGGLALVFFVTGTRFLRSVPKRARPEA
jgi:hypothetical protein